MTEAKYEVILTDWIQMFRVPRKSSYYRKAPLLVGLLVLGTAFSLASLRTNSVEKEQQAASANAYIHFNGFVSQKVDQLDAQLAQAESLVSGIYAGTETGDSNSLPKYLQKARAYETNPSLRAVAIVTLSDEVPGIAQLASSVTMDADALVDIIYALPLPQTGTSLRIIKDPAFTDADLFAISYRPSQDNPVAAFAIFDAHALLGRATGANHGLLVTLTSPDGAHTFAGSEHQDANRRLSDPSDPTPFDQEVELSVYGDPWLLDVTMSDPSRQAPAGRESDTIVLSGVLLALLGVLITMQVTRTREQDRERIETAERGRTETEQRLMHGFEQSPIGVAELDFNGAILRANSAMTDLLGLEPGELDNRHLSDHLVPRYRAAHKVRLQHLHKHGFGATKTEVEYAHLDGSVRTVRENISVVPASTEHSSYVLLQAEDVTEERKATDELASQALRDELTGIPNRALFSDRLAHELKSRRRRTTQLAVMFIDVDQFKVVNDSLGHTVGDDLIIAMAQRLQEAVRKGDTVARFGGDEFVVIADDIKSADDAAQLANKLCSTFRESFDLGDRQIRATVSIGVALSYQDVDVETMLRNADIALYRAKDKGRDRAELFSAEMHTEAVTRQILEEELRIAIKTDQLRTWYQPIMSAATGEIKGVEALVRWEHPTRGLLSPFHFLGLANETGLSSAIDNWVLNSATAQLSHWRARYEPVKHWSLSINATPKHLLEDGYVYEIRRSLKASKFPPHKLIVEVTEDSMLADLEHAAAVLHDLAALRVRVAIDDFGTGYSSMSMLATLKINRLKIDASFVQSMRQSHESASIVETCIRLAQALQIPVVAEGVEELEDLVAVTNAGADLIQGYVYSPPQPAAVIEDILLQHNGQWPLVARSHSTKGVSARSA